MPLYNTATVAAAMGVTPKRLDNLLSHNKIDGLRAGPQGVARRLSVNTVTILMLARDLIDAAGIPASVAIRMASRMVNSPNGEIEPAPGFHIRIQKEAFHEKVLARLSRAVEMAPTKRRGRPPKR
jgi:hypothetical protein